MIHILLVLGGVAIGWLIKIPFFFNYYNDIKKENAHIKELINKLNENKEEKSADHYSIICSTNG